MTKPQTVSLHEKNGVIDQASSSDLSSKSVYHTPLCIPVQLPKDTSLDQPLGTLHKQSSDALSLFWNSFQQEKKVVRDIQKGVNCLRWHPFKSVLAIEHSGHAIFLYSLSNKSWFPSSPSGLTHASQKNISDIAWHPFAASTLAVATSNGICLWRLVHTTGVANYNSSFNDTNPLYPNDPNHQPQAWMQHLTLPNYNDVSTVQWSPDGQFLIAGYYNRPCLVVWDVCELTPTILSRGPACGTEKLVFSPNGSWLIQILKGGGFLIWETIYWDMKRLDTSTEVNSLIWINDSKTFLFSMNGSSKIHLLQMKADAPNLETIVSPSLILPEIDLLTSNKFNANPIKSMVMDKTGRRLAITFDKKTSVGLYDVQMLPLPVFNSIGWIYGPIASNSHPKVQFANQFDDGALLSVRWDEQVIGFVPCYYH